MGHATPGAVISVTIALSTALGGIERLVHGDDDVRHRDVLRLAREAVATAGAAHAFDDLMPAQLAEQLLQVGQRDLLTLADASERDGTLILAHSQVDHRSHSEAAFSGQSHDAGLICRANT
ncbi:hypothetical protein AWV80_15515 [Cupriavidus sp. UYMU48A]|nr:hypothetical protein AWV80_15515 [Cupriavidus sp. UYMU48A]